MKTHSSKKEQPTWALHPTSGAKGRNMGPQPYAATDGRMDPKICEHSQYIDNRGTLASGRCMDCGAMIHYASWSIMDAPLLTDGELTSWRASFNRFWFGTLTVEEAGKSLNEL